MAVSPSRFLSPNVLLRIDKSLGKKVGACQHCRARKVKCSGTQPCSSCQRREEECVFEEDRRISVSRREYLALKRKLSQIEDDGDDYSRKRQSQGPRSINVFGTIPSPETSTNTGNGNEDESTGADAYLDRNPLVSPSSFVHRSDKRRRTWSPTSSWSFTHRVLCMIAERFNSNELPNLPLITDGDAYQVHWDSTKSDALPDVSDLPSREHALYLTSTVKFHLGDLFQLYDEEEFLANLHGFYDDVQVKIRTCRLWYVQFLVIIAFGEAFGNPSRMIESNPVCSRYFARAMSLLPDPTKLWDDPVLAVEVLAAVSLYLYSLDMRDSSCCYIGQAMRIALIEGFHRSLPKGIDTRLANRCTRIWWTVYILESKFTASEGIPSAIRDEEVTAALWDPKDCSRSAAGLSLHVKVSQLMARALHTVYNPNEARPTLYIKEVQSALRRMANRSSEWEQVYRTRLKDSVSAVSGFSTRLDLSYHLCVIIIIRPLIFSLLLEHLDCYMARINPRPLPAPVQSLVQACVDSAAKSLKILAVLREKHLLETFLPFDLEYAFASVFVLRLVSAIAPNEIRSFSCTETAKDIIEALILRGNRIAQFRQAELDMLEKLLEPITKLGQDDSRASTSHPVVGQHQLPRHLSSDTHNLLRPSDECPDLVSGVGGSLSMERCDQTEDVGLLSEQIMSVVNQLAVDDLLVDGNIASLGEDRWFWDGG